MKLTWNKLARIAVASMAIGMLASPVMAQSKRPTVAILDLDYGTIDNWWGSNYDVGKGVADLIVDGLVEDGSYRVIERKRLDALLAEQNFSNSDRADQAPPRWRSSGRRSASSTCSSGRSPSSAPRTRT